MIFQSFNLFNSRTVFKHYLYYRTMVVIRQMENMAATLYQEKKIRGFCHLYSGQEAVAIGFKAALRPQDTVITAYR